MLAVDFDQDLEPGFVFTSAFRAMYGVEALISINATIVGNQVLCQTVNNGFGSTPPRCTYTPGATPVVTGTNGLDAPGFSNFPMGLLP